MQPDVDDVTTPVREAPGGRGEDTGPSAAQVVAALERAVAGTALRASPRTCDFLRYVVTETLEGRADGLRERSIGANALARGDGFDPRFDPAVRVQASRLRKALDRHYTGEGAGDPVRIEVPHGTYVPLFRWNASRPGAGRTSAGPSLVVTALGDLTPGGDHAYIAPGLSEVLVAALSRFPGLRVIGPVPAAPGGMPATGSDLGAAYVLAGSVRLRGDALRVSVRLVDVASREVTWSRVLDRRLGGQAFEFEDEIVAEIGAQVADYRGAAITGSRSPSGGGDPVVVDAMLRYYGWLADTAPAAFLPTVAALEEAVRREPENPLVLAMLAGMNLVDAIDRIAGLDDPVRRAEELAGRAIDIDPSNPHAVAALAWLALVERRIDVCHGHLEHLLRLVPHHPTFLYRAGFVLAVTGQWERGVGLVVRSLALNPDGPGYLNFFPAMDLCLRGDHAAALQRAYLVNTPGGHLGPISRLVPLAYLGRIAEARAELDALRAAVPAFDRDPPAALRKMLMPGPVVSEVLAAVDAVDRAPAGG